MNSITCLIDSSAILLHKLTSELGFRVGFSIKDVEVGFLVLVSSNPLAVRLQAVRLSRI